MNPPVIFAFGDPIIYDGKEYVYLAKEEGVIHLAEVLSREDTTLLVKARDNSVRRQGKGSNNTIYSFVELKTEELKERAAWLNKPDRNAPENLLFNLMNMDFSLIKEDKEELKKEILEPNSGATGGLKKLVKDIKF